MNLLQNLTCVLNKEILKSFHFHPAVFCLHERLSKAATVEVVTTEYNSPLRWCYVPRPLPAQRPRLLGFALAVILYIWFGSVPTPSAALSLRWNAFIWRLTDRVKVVILKFITKTILVKMPQIFRLTPALIFHDSGGDEYRLGQRSIT
jgi:hypothetical protein